MRGSVGIDMHVCSRKSPFLATVAQSSAMLLHVDAREQRKARREVVAQLTAEREARGRNKKGASRFRRIRRRVGAVLIELLAPKLLRLMSWTWRIERTGAQGIELLHSERSFICTMWHGRMLTLMPIKMHCKRGIGVLVSPSEDGGLAKRALDQFGYKVVRGSLSKRGATAMREMHHLVESGGRLVITPDGPRGPRHSINSGAAWLSRATGAPILPVSVAMDRAWRFRSWDRMTIPKPFAKVSVHYGDPITIGKDTPDDVLETRSTELRSSMIAAEQSAFEALAAESDIEPSA
jgi:lysophospholipid acyltransferase (LPLAT)-like uncharacterized protein